MQDISQDTLNEAAKLAQSARITLWEIDLTQSGGDRYFFCNEANEKGEAVTWQGQKYDVYPVEGSGFEMNGKGAAARPSLKVRDQLSRMNLITLPPIRQKMPAAAAPGDAPCVTIPETLAVSSPLINFHSKSS